MERSFTAPIDLNGLEEQVVAAVRTLREANDLLTEAHGEMAALTELIRQRQAAAHAANCLLEEALQAAGADVRTERYS